MSFAAMRQPRSATMPFPRRQIPNGARVRQRFPTTHIEQPQAEIRERLLGAGLRRKIFPGARVAITAGSRGMGGFLELVLGTVDAVRAAGGEPFLVPAMGSHGGATAAGQVEILSCLGVTEQSVSAPIQATMETVELGPSSSGAIAHVDKIAMRADGIIVLGRTKAHPENKAGVASGLLKMVTVGLGKQIGAKEAHSHGLWDSVKAVPLLTLRKAKILFGIAVVENAFRQPALIEIVEPAYDAFHDADVRLLKAAAPHAGSLPFDQLDVLVVDEMGKDISGTGMDLNIIGKWRLEGGKREPDFYRIVALSLTRASVGNGLGIGLADFTTERFARDYDPAATYVNLLTACEPGVMNTREGPMPLALRSDREVIEVALDSALSDQSPRVCRIQSTARLDEFWASEALLGELSKSSRFEILEEPRPMAFDASDNLF